MEPQKKRGRPFQDKVVRPYSVDKIIAEFIDRLPDGERSRFVNHLLRQGVAIEKLSGKFCTYLLMRPDGSVFYVGKGVGDRIEAHEIETRKGIVSHKCNVIRKVWEDGEEIIKQKIAFFDEEEDAYALEILLIEFFGRDTLANQTDGGEGNSGPRFGTNPIRTNISLDEKQLERLRAKSQIDNIPVSELVRRAVDAFLAWNDPTYHPDAQAPQKECALPPPHE